MFHNNKFNNSLVYVMPVDLWSDIIDYSQEIPLDCALAPAKGNLWLILIMSDHKYTA